MADWNTPTTTTDYITVLDSLKLRDLDAATLFKNAPSNTPVGAIKFERTAKKFQEWDGAAWVDMPVGLAGGGTGATTAATARTALGLGTMSTQNSNNVTITGGSLNGAALNGNDITSGTVARARVAAATAYTDTNNIFSAKQNLNSNAEIDNAAPILDFRESDRGADLKRWRIIVEGSLWRVQTVNDAYSSADDGLVLDRNLDVTVARNVLCKNLDLGGTRTYIGYRGDTDAHKGRLGIVSPDDGVTTQLFGYDEASSPIGDPWTLAIGSSSATFITQRARLWLYGHHLVEEITSAPSNPSADNQFNFYLKGDKVVIAFNRGGTMHYYTLDMTADSGTWSHTTVAP